MTDNVKAALLMMGALAMLALNDTAIKTMALTIPLFQIVVLRNGVTTLALGFSILRGGKLPRLSRRDLALSLLRGVGEVGAAYFYLIALVAMPFANVVAILQSAPLVVTLAAALFLGEKVGWRRLSAILVGFVGVLLIVRPGTEGFDIFALDVLISVGFITLRDLATRRLSREAPAMTVTAITSSMVLAFFVVLGLDEPWVPMSAWSIVLTFVAAGFVLGSYLTTIQAMRIGEISFVSPFRYTSLLWALLLGFVLFGEWPQALTLIGAAIVVASGLFTLYRERKTGQPVPQGPEVIQALESRP
ncbi:DMT family transporter [Pseudooceanicola spongiae]|uniref:EamA family transporter n=1 Tax=Pseudooceanicola spongiae TaxID=2613965 RepID=A0A7L9WR17_9RHOB|nr:DMT family transporter [Pseudooceanicola spongiae]QOL82835.1 EamA family transporter [Pseudooceanicola spongiae]